MRARATSALASAVSSTVVALVVAARALPRLLPGLAGVACALAGVQLLTGRLGWTLLAAAAACLAIDRRLA